MRWWQGAKKNAHETGKRVDFSVLYPRSIRSEFVAMYYRDFLAFNYSTSISDTEVGFDD